LHCLCSCFSTACVIVVSTVCVVLVCTAYVVVVSTACVVVVSFLRTRFWCPSKPGLDKGAALLQTALRHFYLNQDAVHQAREEGKRKNEKGSKIFFIAIIMQCACGAGGTCGRPGARTVLFLLLPPSFMHCSALDWTVGVLGIVHVCTCVCMCGVGGGGRVGALLLRGASCKGSFMHCSALEGALH